MGVAWFVGMVFARGNAAHIGASGVVYALASYHFFSGLIRRNTQLLAFSLVVIFFYGSMVWGVFPDFFPEKNISWESHLMGALPDCCWRCISEKRARNEKSLNFLSMMKNGKGGFV